MLVALAARAPAQQQFAELGKRHLPADVKRTAAVVVGDVDVDGDLDLVVGNVGQDQLYLNNGSGTFTDATAARMPVANDNTRALALGDVDGDGDLDLVVGNGTYAGGQQNRLYLNNGSGTFTDATAARMPVDNDRTLALALGDVDGDGDLDLVVGNYGQQNRLYLNNGSGTFTDATAARMPVAIDITTSLALGDVDGDVDLDIVFGYHQDRLYLNLLRQLDAPYLLRSGQTYQLDVYARYGPPRPFDLALPYLAFAAANIPVPPFGTVRIDPNSAVALPWFQVPQPAGIGSLAIAVPNVPALAGIPTYSQALLISVQNRLTNVSVDAIWQ